MIGLKLIMIRHAKLTNYIFNFRVGQRTDDMGIGDQTVAHVQVRKLMYT